MQYTFFDVETANEDPSSICAIGIVSVKDNQIKEKKYYLIKPEPLYVDPFYTTIHSITEEMLIEQPKFNEIWDSIKYLFNNVTLIAHYSPFDMRCLRETLEYYNIEFPEASYSCSYAISRRIVKGLPNYKLNTLADHYNIKFKHHNALSDAETSFSIISKIMEDNGLSDLEQIHKQFKIRKGYIKSNGEWSGYRSISLNKSNTIAKNIKAEGDPFDENHIFFNKQIVFTGAL